MLRRSQRIPRPKTIWEEKRAPSAAKDPKITKKAARTEKETALKPIATGPLPGLDEKHLPELPTYKSPLELHFEPSKSLATGLSELHTFQRLLTPAIINVIVEATNNYALNARGTTEEDSDLQIRPWKPVNSTDIWRYIGCLLYMGYHKKGKHEEHWQESGYLNEFLSLVRFQQIHRYFTLRDKFSHPRQENETFAWQVEPIASIIKENCKAAWWPSSHLAVDEAMIAYRGRTVHKVKLPNKPIKEGYKVWVLGDSGYVYDWLWHSRINGPEGIPQEGLNVDRVQSTEATELTKIHLAPTFALVIRLAQHLRQIHPTRVFCFFLDNLFLNLNVSQALLALRICCTGTTRKNAQGIPDWLVKLKEHNKGLVWNSILAEVVDSTLCFLWQDNNAVLGLTTAHCLKNETVERLRKRPSPTSTNARIVRPVFGDLPFKRLHIPQAIDDYNHFMNGVDRSNQLRKNFTVHRPYERRIWRPLWYYMLDVCAVNGYLIWKGDSKDKNKRGQRCFRDALIKTLLKTPYSEPDLYAKKHCHTKSMPLPNQNMEGHHLGRFGKRGYCVWCKKNAQEEVLNRVRPALAEISNLARPGAPTRQSRTYGGCIACNAFLCIKGACFEQYHSRSNSK